MDLHQIAQHAEDLDRATDFYTTRLGGQLLAKFDPPGLVFLRLGAARLLLDRAAPSALLYFRVADVRAETDRLRAAGVAVETEPHLLHTDESGSFGPAGWQEWLGFVRDSEGNLVGLGRVSQIPACCAAPRRRLAALSSSAVRTNTTVVLRLARRRLDHRSRRPGFGRHTLASRHAPVGSDG